MNWRNLFPRRSRVRSPQEQAAHDLQQLVNQTREKNLPWTFRRRDQLSGERRARFEKAMNL